MSHDRPLGWRLDVPIMFVLMLLSGAYVWMRVSQHAGYFAGDIVTQFLPNYVELAERLRGGDIPGWNAALFSGMPFVGDPISGWSYLPVTGSFLVFNPLTAYKMGVFFHISAATVATYLFARTLRMGPIGSTAAALAMLFSPILYYPQCCAARMQLSPWIPIGLLTIELSQRSQRSWVRMLCWIGTGFVIWQMIAGYFGKGMYYGVLVLGAYLAYRTLIDPPLPQSDWKRRIGNFGISAAMVVGWSAGFSAIVVLPRLDFLNHANLKGGTYEVVAPTAVNEPAWSAGQAIATALNPARGAYYLGAATIALAIAGVFLAGRRFAAPFFALLTVSAMVLTMPETPLHQFFYLLPKFKVIHEHAPHRVLVVLNIGPAILAGAAVAVLEQRLTSMRRWLIAAVAPVVAIPLFTWLAHRDHRIFKSAYHDAAIEITLLLLAGALCAWLMHGKYRPLVAVVLPLLLVATLWSSLDRGRFWDATKAGWKSSPVNQFGLVAADREDSNGAGEFLQAQQEQSGPFRYFGYHNEFLSYEDDYMKDNYHKFWSDILAAHLLLDNRARALGLQEIQGYNPVMEMNYLTFINALNGRVQEYHETNVLPVGLDSPLLPLLNVRYIVIPLSDEGVGIAQLTAAYPEVFRNENVRVLEIPDALPRAWTVHQVNQVAEGDVLPALASGSIDPKTAALMVTTPPPVAPLPAGASDQVQITDYQDDEITLTANLASDGLLILSEVYDPGWTAKVDDKTVPIAEVNGLLRGIAVSEGEHTIKLVYAPSSIRNGIAITALTTFLAITAVLLLWWKEPEEWLRVLGIRKLVHANSPATTPD